MKTKFSTESLRPFIDMSDLKGTEEVLRKQYIGDITIQPDEERTVVARISTIGVDAEGDCIVPQGADLKRFSKNSVIHVNHSYKVEDVIGKATEIGIDSNGIVAKIKFADTQKALDVWQLVKGSFVKANSIGFIIKSALYAGTEEFRKYIKDNALKVSAECKRLITSFELLESSIVSLPCNPQALMTAISAKSITLSEDTIKELDLPKVIVLDSQIAKAIEPEAVMVVKEVKEEAKAVDIAKTEQDINVEVKTEVPVVEVKEVIKAVELPVTTVEAKFLKVIRSGKQDVNELVKVKKLALRGKIL